MELTLTYEEIVSMSSSVEESIRLLNDRLLEEGFDPNKHLLVTEDIENRTFTYSQSN